MTLTRFLLLRILFIINIFAFFSSESDCDDESEDLDENNKDNDLESDNSVVSISRNVKKLSSRISDLEITKKLDKELTAKMIKNVTKKHLKRNAVKSNRDKYDAIKHTYY